MLRSHRHLLILPLASLPVLLLTSSPILAQPEESTAPWRLESAGPINLLLVEPLDINTVNLETLAQVPGLTPDLAQGIIEYRNEAGPFQSLDDLHNVEGINEAILETISNYIKVIHDIDVYTVSYICRYRQDYPASSAVRESSYRFSQRLRVENSAGVALGVGLDKDPGEEELWDHSSLALEIPLPKLDGRLILGDYLVGFGHGLVIKTRRNYGLGRRPDGNLRVYPEMIKAYHSWDENIALRGVAFITQMRKIGVSAWASSRYRDARVNENGRIISFDLSGLHRTESEESHRDVCREETAGVHVAWVLPESNLTIGFTSSVVNWNLPFLFDDSPIFDTYAAGIDLRYAVRRISAMVECAWDDRGNGAQMADVQFRSVLFRSALALYHVDPDYFAPLASGLDFELGEVNNREGVYSHFKIYLPRGFLSGVMHLYQFPRRLPGESWRGQDFSLYAAFKLLRGIESSFSSRWVQEEDPETPNKVSRWRGSASIAVFPGNNWRLEPELRLARVHETEGLDYLIGLAMKRWWRPLPKFSVETEIGLGYYDADEYSQRLYWVEYDISRSMRVRPLWYRGALLEIKLNLKHSKWGSLHIDSLWDQPDDYSDRSPSRSLTVTFKYPI